MPRNLPAFGPLIEVRFQQILSEVVAISQEIRSSALFYANNQNVHLFDRLRRQLEAIRVSADTIAEAITRASLTDYYVDDRLLDWLICGGPSSCLCKLKEMSDILPCSTGNQARPSALVTTHSRKASADDKLALAMAFFDKHVDLFRFLLTPDVWNPEQVPRHADLPDFISSIAKVQDDTETDYYTATEYELGEDRPVSNAIQTMASHNRELLHQKLNEAIRWLVPLDCTEKHSSTLRLHQEGTCKWFPDTDAYKKWRTGRDRFLWLHGQAGCGKSVLIASTIEYLKTTLRKGEVAVFFYFDFQNERSSTPIVMMRSLLSQLLCCFRDLGINPEDLPDKILDEKSKGTLSLNDLDKMCGLVLRAVHCFLWYPIIVIDALDECTDIETLLPILDKLKQDDIRLLMTSRPYEDMMLRFSGLRSLSFENGNVADEVAADIALHVTRVVGSHDRLRATDPDIKNEICAKLNEKAEGRFRWVQCQLDSLKQCASGVELKETLENLPNELDTTYERILWKIDERRLEGSVVRRTLAWLVVAWKPLRLTQVVDGLLADPEQQRVELERQELGKVLLSSLSSLVSHFEETDFLVLSHFSVKEYLTSSVALPIYRITCREAHADIAKMCMRYVSVFMKRKFPRDYIALSKSFPMLSYVLSYGFDHITHVDPRSTVILKTLQALGEDVHHHPSQWDRVCELREEDLRWFYPPWPTSRHDIVLYILIAYSPLGLLETFLSTHHPIQPRIAINPLVYAADLRKTEHAIALLVYDINMDKNGLMIDDSRKASPLEVAIDLSDDVLVGELVARRCVVTFEVLSIAVCMPWCSAQVLARLMQTDEFVNWAREIGNQKLYRAVFNSARPNAGDSRKADEDHVALARRLREIDQDPSTDILFGTELVERALHAGHMLMLEYLLPLDQTPPPHFLLAASTGDTPETVAVVRFLLQRGVDVNAVSDGSGDTALHLAAMCPWEPRSLELTQVIVGAGCDPRAPNLLGETPLIVAAKHGHLSVVEHLLSCQPFPYDILPVALQKRVMPHAVDLLIRRGANVNSTTSDRDTVFHLAITQYDESTCLDLIKVLIKAGCNSKSPNRQKITAFEIALQNSYTSVVDCLIFSCNVQLRPDVLPYILQKGTTLRMVEFLIGKGADVHSTTSNGDTVLHLAIANHDESTCLALVKSLVKAGCNPTTSDSVLRAAVKRGFALVLEQLLLHIVRLPPDILPIALRDYATPEMVEFLIHKGADVNSTTSNGETVLQLAISSYAESMCMELVRIFIEAGCNPTACDFTGKTALNVAVQRGFTSMVDQFLLLYRVPFPRDILLFALQSGTTLRMVEFLIDKGANVNSTTSTGDTVLHLAIAKYPEERCLNLIRSFTEAGCDLAARNSDGKGVLEVAVDRCYSSVVAELSSHCVTLSRDILPNALQNHWSHRAIELLIRGGADVMSTTSIGDTVLHLAVANYSERRCLGFFRDFIKAGCDPNARNSEGKTVLDVAIEQGRLLVVAQLLLHNVPLPPDVLLNALQNRSTPRLINYLVCTGANVSCVTSDGDTVLHLTISSYDESACLDLIKTFVKAGCDHTARNGKGETALEAATKRADCTSVERYLLSCDIRR